MSTWRVMQADVREGLARLPAGSAQTCITSPPYWGLRDYGAEGQLGLEATPEAYVLSMVEVFRDVRRVLRDDGTLWLNLGDSYARDGGAVTAPGATASAGNTRANVDTRDAALASSIGLKPKDLVGIPWRVAFALQADGWYLRQDIIWHKPNPMPESVTDRCTKAHEYIFLMTKSPRYFYDAAAVSEKLSGKPDAPGNKCDVTGGHLRNDFGTDAMQRIWGASGRRNRRSVWTVNTQPYPEAHFATFPEALIEPCILAGSALGDTVLDPFAGSGTTGAVAIRHQRNFVGTELNPDYVRLARMRIGAVAPLFAEEVA